MCAKLHQNRLKTVASRPKLTGIRRKNKSRRIGAFSRSVKNYCYFREYKNAPLLTK